MSLRPDNIFTYSCDRIAHINPIVYFYINDTISENLQHKFQFNELTVEPGFLNVFFNLFAFFNLFFRLKFYAFVRNAIQEIGWKWFEMFYCHFIFRGNPHKYQKCDLKNI